MQNTKLLLTSLTFVGLLALAGCSFPGVYKIDIQQGNVVTQDMIDQLKPGMTRRQVRFIMGNPLITDTFHANRWDYLYSIQPGGGQRQQERMSIIFNDSDQLVALSGDFMPGVSRDQAREIPSARAAPATAVPLSPLAMITSKPMAPSDSTADAASARSGTPTSNSATRPCPFPR